MTAEVYCDSGPNVAVPGNDAVPRGGPKYKFGRFKVTQLLPDALVSGPIPRD